MVMSLYSGAFEHGQKIPRTYGYKNGNTSPPLHITGIPPSTISLALVMDDPDAMEPAGKVWVHWVVWNINPAEADFVENAVPEGATQGMTDFGTTGYGGPAPPDKEHTYIFKLYALDTELDLAADSGRAQVEAAIKGHIIEESRLEGRYSP